MRYAVLIFIVLTTILSTCEKPIEDKLEIISGTVCGWCGGDTLIMNITTTSYESFNYCDDTTYFLEEATNKEAWNNILNSYSWKAFNAEDVNTCNVCVDGCDTWIIVHEEEQEHRISYGQPEEINNAEIREFAEKLSAHRAAIYQKASASE